jgi:Flp pilus assembly protein TadB
MTAANQSYRKKQAYLMILVFACIGVAIWGGSPLIAVGAILAACGLCFWAATMEPQKSPEEHHHH